MLFPNDILFQIGYGYESFNWTDSVWISVTDSWSVIIVRIPFYLLQGKRHSLSLIVPTTENGEELCIWVFFQLFFQAKSGTTKNHRTGSSDMEAHYVVIRTLLKKFPTYFPSVEKNRFEIFCLFMLNLSLENLLFSSKVSFWSF